MIMDTIITLFSQYEMYGALPFFIHITFHRFKFFGSLSWKYYSAKINQTKIISLIPKQIYIGCWSRSGNQWIWVKNFKSVQTFRISSVTYMKRFEDNKKVFSVRLCPPEAIFWRRGQMVGKKWAISENHHIFYFCL